MMFGNVNRFAVEAEVYLDTPHLFGHFCLWANHQRIGEYEQNVILGTPVVFIEDFLNYDGIRNHPVLTGKSNEQILELFHATLYSDVVLSPAELGAPEFRELSQRLIMCEICPRFSPTLDGDEAVLLEYPDCARFIWRAFDTDTPMETSLFLGECQSVLTSFVEWVKNYDREKHPLLL